MDARTKMPGPDLHGCEEHTMNGGTGGYRRQRRTWASRTGRARRHASRRVILGPGSLPSAAIRSVVQWLAANGPGLRDIPGTCRRPGGLAVLVATAAIGLAACGGSSTPHVASLGSSSGKAGSATTGSSTAALPRGTPTQLLNDWAACMRRHGDPDQADPTVDTSNGIHVTVPLQYYGTIYGPSSNNPSGAGVTCQGYLTAASNTLNGGQPPKLQSLATLDKYADCMRANGVPDYPEPGAGGGVPVSNPDSPIVQKAAKVCEQKTGAYGLLPGGRTISGEIEITNPNVPSSHNITVVLN
jgi:hypothetical protein